jgi:hypothetical protein
MLKKSITYTDFNGNEQTEDFYFHLSRTELTEMEVSVTGGMSETLKRIVATENAKDLIEIFKKIILDSVGEKTEDGKRFVKNEAITEDFVSSPAFDVLFMDLATNSDAAAAFIKGIMPPDFAAQMELDAKKAAMLVPEPVESTPPTEET